MQFRQGDILLVRTEEPLPESSVIIERDRDRVVLAYGEVTNHTHRFEHPGATLYAVKENLRILELEEEAELLHEEHAAIKIAPGRYQVIQQRENTALGWRTVVD